MRRVSPAAGALLLLLSTAGQSQTPTPRPSPEATATPAPSVEALMPGPEMRRLQWMVGSWRVLEIHETTDWGPSGGGRGTQTVVTGPGGFSVLTDYKSSGPQGQIAGHGILAWDPEKRGYEFHLADSVTPGVMELTCVWKKDDLVCDGRALFLGMPMHLRWTMTGIGPNSYTAGFDTSADGRTYRRAVTFRYSRP